jgi:hypothetical protein
LLRVNRRARHTRAALLHDAVQPLVDLAQLLDLLVA